MSSRITTKYWNRPNHLVLSKFVVIIPLLIGFGLDNSISTAQSKILSKQPPVMSQFDSEKNESNVSTFFFNPMSGPNGNSAMTQLEHPSPLRLISAEYTYPGTIPSRPNNVSFILAPLEKYKTAPRVFVKADEALLLEGEATINELCCEEVKGHKHTLQQIIIAVPTDTFERIAKAKKVEFKLVLNSDKHSVKFNDYDKKCISALAATIK